MVSNFILTLHSSKWPALLEPLLLRLNEIVHNDFPLPILPPQDDYPPFQSSGDTQMKTDSNTDQSISTGEATQSQQSRPLPPIPMFDSSNATNVTHVPDSLPASQTAPTDIPELLITQLESITTTLRSSFSTKPPHTIQRLAELVLSPNKHYRTLPAWLRAVDRAVSVSSTADIFPLPTAQPLPPSMVDASMVNGIQNGNNNNNNNGGAGTGTSTSSWSSSSMFPSPDNNGGLGSDESLGGALLTPIPWLKNGEAAALSSPRGPAEPLDSSDLPHSSASSSSSEQLNPPEREDGAITQGELIRREQEAGIVPVSHSGNRVVEGNNGEVMEDGAVVVVEDSAPHATGPNVVGVEDMGLQDGQGVELQLNRKPPEGAGGVQGGGEGDGEGQGVGVRKGEGKEEEEGDGDIVLTDADGKSEEDVKADASGENEGPDAADTTTI
ncbi:MAG: hypothetical protein Q9227_000497 [Pyrenula ochraceoflavens]